MFESWKLNREVQAARKALSDADDAYYHEMPTDGQRQYELNSKYEHALDDLCEAVSQSGAPAGEPVGYAIVDCAGSPTTELWLTQELADAECVIFNGADNLKHLRPFTVRPPGYLSSRSSGEDTARLEGHTR